MVLVDDVHKSYGQVRAVRGVSFELPAGQVVGLLGPNGAGKTTTIRMITGFTPPDAGRVVVHGFDMAGDSASARRRIGYLPESAPLYMEMRVADYLHFRAKLFGVPRPDRMARVGKALAQCWLTEVQGRRIGQLSKGFKQRVGLAGALVHEPPVLVLDEPTNGLDPTQIHETRKLIRELAKDRTLLLSSHVLSEVERLCDRVIVMAYGKVQADGRPADLIERARLSTTHIVELKLPAGGLESAKTLLIAVPGVANVAPVEGPKRPEDGWANFVITPKPGVTDLREPIALATRQAGVLVRTLQRDSPSLERLFMDLIERADDNRATGLPGPSANGKGPA
jgi:ABC-2 type transport system ATP-binding protein